MSLVFRCTVTAWFDNWMLYVVSHWRRSFGEKRLLSFVPPSVELGWNPFIPQYDPEIHLKDDTISNVPPPEPRQAFGGPTFYDDEHIYEEPAFTPASLPQTHLVSPRQNQARGLIPTQYASGYVERSRGRPTSASQHPGAARLAGSTRPTSARTEPRYAPSPARTSPPDRSMAQPSLPVSE